MGTFLTTRLFSFPLSVFCSLFPVLCRPTLLSVLGFVSTPLFFLLLPFVLLSFSEAHRLNTTTCFIVCFFSPLHDLFLCTMLGMGLRSDQGTE